MVWDAKLASGVLVRPGFVEFVDRRLVGRAFGRVFLAEFGFALLFSWGLLLGCPIEPQHLNMRDGFNSSDWLPWVNSTENAPCVACNSERLHILKDPKNSMMEFG